MKIILVVTLLFITSASGMFLFKQFRAINQEDVEGIATELISMETPSSSPEATPTPKPNAEPVVIYKESHPTPTPISQAPMPTQVKVTDSATHIELCKTKAETFKTQTMTALVLVYNQNNADAMKIANTSSVEELVDVSISIGLITREQYNSDPSGHQLALLQTRTKVMAEIKSFMDTVNGKGSLAYNDYYAKCLSNEN